MGVLMVGIGVVQASLFAMEAEWLPTLLGVIYSVLMVGIGVVQASLFAMEAEWLPTLLGVIYSVLGIAFLWVEVFTAD
ncbi:hypothetical protein C446_17434 [Halobiforma nitratireducens JCM 10879]|uniref:Uncharacterized protein n=1 Tax=Halobiforma nitratireducens JCM 10879 TaxID=1227454 RepID=M0L6N8_9EURY|nr:hypothetical protein C446_17434 [Halobiforma nitratireducens JCM 10879]